MISLDGLTCDIQGNGGFIRLICVQMTRENCIVIFSEDRCDTHTAATLLVVIIQLDHCTIPQPHQFFISLNVAANRTCQRYSLLSFHLNSTLTIDSWGGLDIDALVEQRREMLKLSGIDKWRAKMA